MKALKTVAWLTLLPVLAACSPVIDYELDGSRETAPGTLPPAVSSVITAVTADPVPDPTFRTPEQSLEGLAEFDGGQSIFLIATLEGDTTNPIFPIDDRVGRNAAIERLNAVKTKYNLQIADNPTTVEALIGDLEANIQVDGYTVDLILLPAEYCSAFEGKNVLIDPSRIAFFDENADYLDSDYAAIYDDYAIFGDALFYPEDRLCVYYNYALAESLGIGSLYNAAKDGRWTWDLLAGYASRGGLATELSMDYLLPVTSGLSYSKIFDSKKNLKKLPEEYRTKVDGVLSEIGDKFTDSDPLNAFLAGQSLFYIGKVSDCAKLSEMRDAWSILPVPTESGTTEVPVLRDYRDRDYVFLIPRFPYSPERTIQVIAAFCSVRDGTRQAAYESYLPYMRLNESRILLDIVLK